MGEEGENLYETASVAEVDPMAAVPTEMRETINGLVLAVGKNRTPEEQGNLRYALLSLLQPNMGDQLISGHLFTAGGLWDAAKKAGGATNNVMSLDKVSDATVAALNLAKGATGVGDVLQLTKDISGATISTALSLGTKEGITNLATSASDTAKKGLSLFSSLASTGMTGIKNIATTATGTLTEGVSSTVSATANLHATLPNAEFRAAVVGPLKRVVELRKDAASANSENIKAMAMLQARQLEAYLGDALKSCAEKEKEREESSRSARAGEDARPPHSYQETDMSEGSHWDKLGDPYTSNAGALGSLAGGTLRVGATAVGKSVGVVSSVWGKVSKATRSSLRGEVEDEEEDEKGATTQLTVAPEEVLDTAEVDRAESRHRQTVSHKQIRRLRRKERREERERLGQLHITIRNILDYRGVSEEGAGYQLALGALLFSILALFNESAVLGVLVVLGTWLGYPMVGTMRAWGEEGAVRAGERGQWVGYWAVSCVVVGVCQMVPVTLLVEEDWRLNLDGRLLTAYTFAALYLLQSPLVCGGDALLAILRRSILTNNPTPTTRHRFLPNFIAHPIFNPQH